MVDRRVKFATDLNYSLLKSENLEDSDQQEDVFSLHIDEPDLDKGIKPRHSRQLEVVEHDEVSFKDDTKRPREASVGCEEGGKSVPSIVTERSVSLDEKLMKSPKEKRSSGAKSSKVKIKSVKERASEFQSASAVPVVDIDKRSECVSTVTQMLCTFMYNESKKLNTF